MGDGHICIRIRDVHRTFADTVNAAVVRNIQPYALESTCSNKADDAWREARKALARPPKIIEQPINPIAKPAHRATFGHGKRLAGNRVGRILVTSSISPSPSLRSLSRYGDGFCGGREAARYHFTSALPAQLFKLLVPVMQQVIWAALGEYPCRTRKENPHGLAVRAEPTKSSAD